MMMTLCIRYKAQLAVTNFGPRHTTHFVLLEKVSGGLATLLSTRMVMCDRGPLDRGTLRRTIGPR